MREQGLDGCSVTRILENYTKPLELPLLEEDGAKQTGASSSRTGPGTENTELSRQPSADTGNVGDPSPEDENKGCKKACLEGDPAFDPVCGSKEQEQSDLKEKAQVSCQEHGFLAHCGCKAEESTEQRSCEMMKSKECAPEYVLVQEEEECSVCPEDETAHGQESVRIKSILIF